MHALPSCLLHTHARPHLCPDRRLLHMPPCPCYPAGACCSRTQPSGPQQLRRFNTPGSGRPIMQHRSQPVVPSSGQPGSQDVIMRLIPNSFDCDPLGSRAFALSFPPPCPAPCALCLLLPLPACICSHFPAPQSVLACCNIVGVLSEQRAIGRGASSEQNNREGKHTAPMGAEGQNCRGAGTAAKTDT